MVKVSIIIVSWNVKNDLLNCLSSLQKNRPSFTFEQIVVDNNSTDQTVSAVRQQFPDVAVIENRENQGFAKANNLGIEIAKGEYVFLLNPDTIVHPNAMEILVKFLDENPDVGACGPKLLNEDGTIQRSVRRFPTFRGVLYGQTICRMLGLFRSHHRKWMMRDFNYDRQIDVDQIMGAAMMIRRLLIKKTGGMDANYFMYLEEVDLCYAIKQTGSRIVFLPNAVITHLGGRSSSQSPIRRLMMLESMTSFFRKHRKGFATGIFIAIFKIGIILRNICHLILDIFTFAIAAVIFDKTRINKAKGNMKLHALLLTKYLWRIITM
ncbi:MAG: glycosyltransferase family 2 protein [Planctomycetaceae bacterium]|nr:glycosyltransferase family 2 protein [Planctomycetaceae bacterium]